MFELDLNIENEYFKMNLIYLDKILNKDVSANLLFDGNDLEFPCTYLLRRPQSEFLQPTDVAAGKNTSIQIKRIAKKLFRLYFILYGSFYYYKELLIPITSTLYIKIQILVRNPKTIGTKTGQTIYVQHFSKIH